MVDAIFAPGCAACLRQSTMSIYNRGPTLYTGTFVGVKGILNLRENTAHYTISTNDRPNNNSIEAYNVHHNVERIGLCMHTASSSIPRT